MACVNHAVKPLTPEAAAAMDAYHQSELAKAEKAGDNYRAWYIRSLIKACAGG